MPDIRNLISREVRVPVGKRRHITLAPAGGPGDTVTIPDSDLLDLRDGTNPIEDLILAGTIEIVAGTYDTSPGSTVAQDELAEALALAHAPLLLTDPTSPYIEAIDGVAIATLSPSGRGRLRYNDTTKDWEKSVDGGAWGPIGGVGVTTFTGLSDTPGSITADGVVVGNGAGTALAFLTQGSGGGLDADTVDGSHASAFALASHTHDAADVTSGTFADARISESSVTQHNAALDHGTLSGNSDDDHTQYMHNTTARTVTAVHDFTALQ